MRRLNAALRKLTTDSLPADGDGGACGIWLRGTGRGGDAGNWETRRHRLVELGAMHDGTPDHEAH
jgi:hypothetical protein